MDTVCFETAKKLKDAGFEQPKFDAGQFWYNHKGELAVITHGGEYQTGFTMINGLREVWTLEDDTAERFFAPTAAEILRHLPGLCIIASKDVNGKQHFPSGHFGIFYLSESDDEGHETKYWNDSPAEAAANAWLFY